MTERSAHVRELFRNFVISDRTKAVLDFHSGLIRVNCTRAQFFEMLDNPEANLPLYETFLHEVQHYMQLSFFGYLYNYITIINGIIESSLPPNISMYSEVPDAVKDQRWLYSIQKDLDRTLDGRVSVLSITESLTYFIQKTSVHGYDPQAHLDHLETAFLLPEYKDAMLYFADAVGEVEGNLLMFPTICQLSLCCYDPPDTFIKLCECIRNGKITTKTYLPEIIEICRQIATQWFAFGFDLKDINQNQFPRHPIYGHEPWDWAFDFQDKFSQYLMKPDFALAAHFLNRSNVTILFNPEEDPEAPGFSQWSFYQFGAMQLEEKKNFKEYVKFRALISRKLMGNEAFGENQWFLQREEHKKQVSTLLEKFKEFNYLLFAQGQFNLTIDLHVPEDRALTGYVDDFKSFLAGNEKTQDTRIRFRSASEPFLNLRVTKHEEGFISASWFTATEQQLLHHDCYMLFLSKRNAATDEKALRYFEGMLTNKKAFTMLRASVNPVAGCFFFTEAPMNDELIHAQNQLLAVAVFEHYGIDLTQKTDTRSQYVITDSPEE